PLPFCMECEKATRVPCQRPDCRLAVAVMECRAHRTGDRAHLPAGSDAARDHSRVRGRRHGRRNEARSGDRQDERPGGVPAASGARVMHARTAYRLAMLANGFQPLLNDCKRSIEKGWPRKIVDEAEVLAWDRSALTSTGLRLDGDLAVIDVDVSEAAMVEALAGALDSRFPELFVHGLVRHAGGAKEAWIA